VAVAPGLVVGVGVGAEVVGVDLGAEVVGVDLGVGADVVGVPACRGGLRCAAAAGEPITVKPRTDTVAAIAKRPSFIRIRREHPLVVVGVILVIDADPRCVRKTSVAAW
jgi:hypothetical protein